MVTGLEAMADAISAHEGWSLGSRSYRNRNPGNLRESEKFHTTDPQGYCVFPGFVAGYLALLWELTRKITGQNKHGIGPTSTLEELFDVYAPRADRHQPNPYARFVAHWCTVALGRVITAQDLLGDICPDISTGGGSP
jgi:hypothetical protein